MAVFYFVGFATGMFKGNADEGPNTQVQVKNIQVEPSKNSLEKPESTFQFHEYEYAFQKKDTFCDILSIQPPPFRQPEKLIYFVHDKKINHSFTSEYYFCRPPPTRS